MDILIKEKSELKEQGVSFSILDQFNEYLEQKLSKTNMVGAALKKIYKKLNELLIAKKPDGWYYGQFENLYTLLYLEDGKWHAINPNQEFRANAAFYAKACDSIVQDLFHPYLYLGEDLDVD